MTNNKLTSLQAELLFDLIQERREGILNDYRIGLLKVRLKVLSHIEGLLRVECDVESLLQSLRGGLNVAIMIIDAIDDGEFDVDPKEAMGVICRDIQEVIDEI